MGNLAFFIDKLNIFFFIITIVVSLSCLIYSFSLKKRDFLMFAGLNISVLLLFVSENAFTLLIFWEIMSLLIYFSTAKENTKSSFIMIAVSEAGTLAILAGLTLIYIYTNSWDFITIKNFSNNIPEKVKLAIFLLTFFGFGVKAGIIPLNFWLPETYTATPKSLIPFIAGATLNTGIYGIIRINFDIIKINEPYIGVIALIIGAVTAFIGILYASIEKNFKTLLAYSSIENSGIIIAGIGASLIFYSSGKYLYSAIAFTASMYHILNHSLYKTLLFISQGIVEENVEFQNIDKMGGLIKLMPITSFFTLCGVIAISGLPPFNGFVSELLSLEALLRSVELSSISLKFAFVIAGVLLALTAGLAVTCFVRLFGMGFLGIARSSIKNKINEKKNGFLFSLAFLSLLCFLLGILPTYTIPQIDKITDKIVGVKSEVNLIPEFFKKTTKDPFVKEFHSLGAQVGKSVLPGKGLVILHRGKKENPVVFAFSPSYMIITLLILIFILFLIAPRKKVIKKKVWDGGVYKLFPEMTYTATGFAQPVKVIFDNIFRPKVSKKEEIVSNYFRFSIKKHIVHEYFSYKIILKPIARLTDNIAKTLAKIHNGNVNVYCLYVLLCLIVFLVLF